MKIAARGRKVVRAHCPTTRGKTVMDSEPEMTPIHHDKIVKEWDPVRIVMDSAPEMTPTHHDKIVVDGDPGQPPLRPNKTVPERGKTNTSTHHSKTDQVNDKTFTLSKKGRSRKPYRPHRGQSLPAYTRTCNSELRI